MQPLLLLHGAIGASVQLQPLALALSETYDVHTLDFSGHGGLDFPDNGFSIPQFAQDVLAYMDEQNLKQINIFGYSMGGYVALYLAKHNPERIGKIVTLASKFHWDEPTAAKEVQMVQADKIEAKLPAFAQTLQDRHHPQEWKEVLKHTADMLLALGRDNTLKPDDYKDIQTPSLLLLGDRDKMVTLEETLSVYKSLPNAALGILPYTAHPVEQANIEMLAWHIARFVK